MSEEKIHQMCEVVNADYLGGHRLHLTFNDGLEGDLDFSDIIGKGVFKPLQDPKKFTQFGLIYGTIVWKPDGDELDIAPEFLYQRVFDTHSNKTKKHGFGYFGAESFSSQ